jgi:membrane protein
VRRPRQLRRALRAYLSEVLDDRLPGLAAETAFFTVLSLFPGLLVGGALLGLLEPIVGAEASDQARENVLDALGLVLTDEASGLLDSVRSLFERSRGGLLTFATLGALVSLSGAFAVAIGALNLAHDAAEQRSWIRRRLLGLGMALGTLVIGVLALLALVVGPLFGRGEQLADLIGLGAAFTFVWDVVRLPVMALVLLLWATAVLRIAPSRRLTWRQALPGALLAALLWALATAGFRLYLGFAAESNPVLGAFGGGAIVMTWTYLLSLGLLLGGELNAQLLQRDADDEDTGEQLALFP